MNIPKSKVQIKKYSSTHKELLIKPESISLLQPVSHYNKSTINTIYTLRGVSFYLSVVSLGTFQMVGWYIQREVL